MAVLPMMRLQLCAMRRDRKEILEFLQRRGVVELTDVIEQDSIFQKSDLTSSKLVFEKSAAVSQQALDILGTYAPEEKSMLAMLEGRREMPLSDYKRFTTERDELLRIAHRLIALSKENAEQNASVLKLQMQIEALTPWMTFDLPLRFEGTKKTAALIGSFAAEISPQDLYAQLAEALPTLDALDIEVVSSGKDLTCVALFCPCEDAPALEGALRALGFTRPALTCKEPPVIYKKQLEDQIVELHKAQEAGEAEIRSFAGARNALKFGVDYFTMRAAKYDVLGRLEQSRRTFVLTGYIPKRECQPLEEALNAKFDVALEFECPSEEEDTPVLLRNNAFTEPMESVVAGYSLPSKGEIDPSSVMAIFYYIFFGMMLSDAIYGLIMVLACGFAMWKFKNMEPGMFKTVKLFFFCGVSTIFWGVMFGSYFGDVVDVVSSTFFGKALTIPPVLFSPVADPMRLLLIAFVFGIIHIFTGLAVSFYEKVRAKAYLDALYDVVFWYMLVGGGIVYLLTVPMFLNIFSLTFTLPPITGTIAAYSAGIGAVGIVLTGGRESRNPVKRLLKGAYALYNVSGYLSDILSYSRLLALGLATGVIATVFNKMGSMMGGGFVGLLMFVVVFAIGHTMNIAINILGAYVHTNRLQYVEFFGKFYEGGGRAFTPFAANTKYYKIKEDI